MKELTVPVRSKDNAGKTITSWRDAAHCQSCSGDGYVVSRMMPDAFEVCRACKGRGLLMRSEARLPQIEDW